MLSSIFLSCNYKIFKPRLFYSHVTSHNADWIPSVFFIYCLAFLYAHNFYLMKVLEVERSGLCLLENCLRPQFLFEYFAHVTFVCSLPSIYFSYANFVAGLLVTSSMCVSVAFGLLFLCEMILGSFHFLSNIYVSMSIHWEISPFLLRKIQSLWNKEICLICRYIWKWIASFMCRNYI